MDHKPSWNSLGTKPLAVPSSAPTDFNPERARKAVRAARKESRMKTTTKAERELRAHTQSVENPEIENPKPVQHRMRGEAVSQKLTAMTPLSHAFRHIEPIWRNYIHYVQRASQAGDDQMSKYLASFHALPPKEQKSVMPETVCSLSGTQAGELIGAVSRYYWEERQSESVITAATNHPKMVQATAYWGQSLADCNRDRELFFRLTGGLPDKKGASIVIHNTNASANLPTSSPHAANGFRTMDQRVIEMGKLLDEPDEAVHPLFSKETARVFAGDSQPED